MGFDAQGWAAERGNYSGKNVRGSMIDGLDDAGVKPGAARDAVRALLGEPDSTGPHADIYFLGRSASGPSFDTYRIEYDDTGRVAAAKVVRD